MFKEHKKPGRLTTNVGTKKYTCIYLVSIEFIMTQNLRLFNLGLVAS